MVTLKLVFNQIIRDHSTAKLTQNYPSQKLTKKEDIKAKRMRQYIK